MNSLTRRSFGFAAVAAPGVLAATASLSKADTRSTVAPALYGASLGSYRITALFDGMAPLRRDMFEGDEAKIDLALSAVGITGDVISVPVNAFLLESNERTILVDSGMGQVEMLGEGLGRAFDALTAAGISPAEIDQIVVTHAHPDHVGGLLENGSAIYPNAEVVISDVELGFWGDSGMLARAPEQAKGLFLLAQTVFAAYKGRVRPVASGTEIAPGIRLELSPGHTPGHAILHIDGGERELLMVADTLHSSTLHTALPEVTFGFDIDPVMAANSRKRVFDRAASDNLLIAATHIPFPGFGRFIRFKEAYSYIPTSWL